MSRSMILLIIAALIAAFMAITVRNRLTQTPAAPEAVVAAPASTRVLTAKRDVAPGVFVQSAADLEWKDLPEGAPKEGTVVEGNVRIEEFNGAIARRPLRAGEVVQASSLMKSGDGGFMSAVLEPNLRAVSIAVNAISGNAGFITPGDRIDLIVTHRVRVMAGSQPGGDESVVSETFVHDVRVLAVDQQLDNPENKAILAKTVTVEVNSHQAEQIAVAAEMGKITMALRGLSSQTKKAAAPSIDQVYTDYTTDGDVSKRLDRRTGFSSRVHIIRGDQSENIEFEKGGQ